MHIPKKSTRGQTQIRRQILIQYAGMPPRKLHFYKPHFYKPPSGRLRFPRQSDCTWRNCPRETGGAASAVSPPEPPANSSLAQADTVLMQLGHLLTSSKQSRQMKDRLWLPGISLLFLFPPGIFCVGVISSLMTKTRTNDLLPLNLCRVYLGLKSKHVRKQHRREAFSDESWEDKELN